MPNSLAVLSNQNPRGGFLAWFVCLSAALFFFYEFFQLNLFDVINQPLREAFAIDATQVSWMSSAYLWANILFLLPAGIILDRYSTRLVILLALLVCVVGTLGFALTQWFWMAFFCHFLTGIGNAFCFVACVVLVSRWFPPRRQALVIGSVVTMAFLGGMMAHTPFVYLTEQYGFRHALLIDAAVGGCFLIWIYIFVADLPAGMVSLQPSTSQSNFWQAFSNKQTWLGGFYISFLNLPIMVLCALWGDSYLQDVHQLAPHQASNTVSLIFMGSIVGCPLLGWLSDRMGRRKPLMALGAVVTLLLAIVLILIPHFSKWQLDFLFFALGLFSSTQVIGYPLIAESNQASNTGAATSMASIIIMGGAGVAQIAFGELLQWHAIVPRNHYTAADFNYAMWMFPITAGIALLAVQLMKETFCERKD